MIPLEEVFALPPFSLAHAEKQALMRDHLSQLTHHHISACEPYHRIVKAFGTEKLSFQSCEDFPYLPVRLFKEYDLKSVPDTAVIKTLTSSGTTGTKVSRIFLDKDTSHYQTKALSCIIQDFIGKKRLPMLVIDSPNVIKDRRLFSARGAGILGMANFGYDHLYVLDDNMQLRREELRAFLDTHKESPILLFGFTFMVWQHFYSELRAKPMDIDLRNGILIHSGGWKKLADAAVSRESFKQGLTDVCGLSRVHNFYGMVEQVGSVYVECEAGHLHAPIFSDVIIRDPKSWKALGANHPGILEVLSILPHSYPGHVLLTEDLGTVLGEDNCSCGRKGKYFQVSGRIPKAEIRGCSDTYES